MDRATNQMGQYLVSELRVTRVWGAEVASFGGHVNHPTITLSDPAQIYVEHS